MHWSLLLLVLQNQRNLSVPSILTPASSEHFLRELRWNLFQVTHMKQYSSHEERIKRKSIFFATLNEIEKHNNRFYRGLETWAKGINQFSDMTFDEFEEIYAKNEIFGNFKIQKEHFSNITRPINHKDINWFTSAIPVKDQGKCGACWTFATTGLLEYDYFIKKKEVVSLSEQELLDCVPTDNFGCKGGVPYYALEFVKESGINYEKDYPYERRQKKCQIRLRKAQKLVQNVEMTSKSETAIYEKLFYSPVIVGVYVNKKVWKDYAKGYIKASDCKRNKINHAILIVGVVKESGRRLWLARNSFGTSWGQNGHLKLAMNEHACQIGESNGFYVTV